MGERCEGRHCLLSTEGEIMGRRRGGFFEWYANWGIRGMGKRNKGRERVKKIYFFRVRLMVVLGEKSVSTDSGR